MRGICTQMRLKIESYLYCRWVRRSLRYGCLWFVTLLLCTGIVPNLTATAIALGSADSTIQHPHLAPLTAAALEQQGQSLYQTGRYVEASQAFLQASQHYQADGNSVQQAIALSNLALSHQQSGEWDAANQAITSSLSLLDREDGRDRSAQWARSQALDIQGHLLLAQGDAESAIDIWEEATQLFQSTGHDDRVMESQVNQAQALQTLGLHRRAATLLTAALHLDLVLAEDVSTNELSSQWSQMPRNQATLPALQSLGEILRVVGHLSLSRQMLQRSLDMAEQTEDPTAIATAQFNLANLTRTEAYATLSTTSLTSSEAVELVHLNEQGDRRRGIQDAEAFVTAMNRALEQYRQAIHPALPPISTLQAQLNALRVLVELDRQTEARTLFTQIQPKLIDLPVSRDAVYARINLAQSLIKLDESAGKRPSQSLSQPETAAQLLSTAVQQARSMGDVRAESYGLGHLGQLYEQVHQVEDAQQVTNQALLLAQIHHASDIAYRWQWQLGRLLQVQADELKERDPERSQQLHTEAIAAYSAAVSTLQSIRSDLVAITPEEQFSFRDTIEPIYRQFVTLLLSTEDTSPDTLEMVRNVIESLQLAELDNFFRQACLTAEPSLVDQIDDTAAVFYPVILPDRLAVIVSLPSASSQNASSSLSYFMVPIHRDQIETTVDLLRDSLDQPNDSRFLAPAQQLYDWLIRPIEAQLDPSRVKTLVFVLDDVLRDVPVAVLHDGEHYLVEQPYGIALTPGLQLLEPQSLSRRQSHAALLAGITDARSGFSALPNVRDELEQIQSVFPRTTTLLDDAQQRSNESLVIDDEFTRETFSTAMRDRIFSIVHLATHGQFSSQANNTFVLTQDGRLSIEDLKALLQSTVTRLGKPLDLLVFSACETASGDRRAALGLAGMATRAGAQSTIATLWNVNDASSAAFMGTFYDALATDVIGKAEALHEAQLSMMHNPYYQHPYFWSPYILIGRWQ